MARHPCDAGSTLKDVTEAVGLVSNERTLACACLADRLLVQVMHKRMQLCSMDAVLSPDQGGHPAPMLSLCPSPSPCCAASCENASPQLFPCISAFPLLPPPPPCPPLVPCCALIEARTLPSYFHCLAELPLRVTSALAACMSFAVSPADSDERLIDTEVHAIVRPSHLSVPINLSRLLVHSR